MRRLPLILVLLAVTALAGPAAAATITIVNNDGANEGFNDPTPAAPIGGNPGTTIGAQRLFVFQTAANIWGSILPSNVQIRVNAQMNPQSCTATSGVLGSAGPTQVFRDFSGAIFPGTWYHVALANKLANVDLSPAQNDIGTTFNSSVGQPTCLTVGWYYGVDGNEGGQIELLPVVLHELGHGLGFSTTTSGQTGTQSGGFPHVYDRFLYDNTQGLHWYQMNDAQRAASGQNCSKLAWDGPNVVAAAPGFLGDKPLLRVNSPATVDGDYEVGLASFGPQNFNVTGNLILVNDGVGFVNNGCEAFVNAAQVNGNIALLDRGGCTFTQKVMNAQNAGAIGVVVADSLPGCPPAGMGGANPSITIPSVRTTQSDGTLIKTGLGTGVNVTMLFDSALMAGSDAGGRVLVYTPVPYAGGSSVSHWDVSAEPSLLMEPAITGGLSSSVDLTTAMFTDIGWMQGALSADGPPANEKMLGASFPNPAAGSSTIRFTMPRDETVSLGVYDARGRLVNRLIDGPVPAGSHAVTWNGTDLGGRRVAAGAYFYRLEAAGAEESRQLVVVW